MKSKIKMKLKQKKKKKIKEKLKKLFVNKMFIVKIKNKK